MNGRASDFHDEIATRICDLLMDGVSLRSICQQDDMPGRKNLAPHTRSEQSFRHATWRNVGPLGVTILRQATRICDLLMDGVSLRSICELEDICPA
jgi:hypothetical protein